MIEPNSHGQELSDIELVDFTRWEHEVQHNMLGKVAERLSYMAALVSANVVMAGQEIKDRFLRVPGLKRGLGAIAVGFAESAAVVDPAAHYSYKKQQHDNRDQ